MKSHRIAILLFTSALFAQSPVLSVASPHPVSAKLGESVDSILAVRVEPGFHANSNSPSDPFLIPLSLTWSAGSLESEKVLFPKPEIRKVGFSEKPVSIFSGEFEIVTHFRVAAGAQPGASSIAGKLHYQACDDHSCRAPATIAVTLPVTIAR